MKGLCPELDYCSPYLHFFVVVNCDDLINFWLFTSAEVLAEGSRPLCLSWKIDWDNGFHLSGESN